MAELRTSRSTLKPFTPSRETAASLAARTVGRDDVLSAIHRRLRTAATTGNRPHSLLVGPRGSGKTHVIEVALHDIAADRRCAGRFVVARIDEDAVGVASYADFLLALCADLGLPAERRAPGDVEAALLAHLGGRVLIVVVENLSRVFDDMGTSGQRALRSLVETSGDIVLLASAPLLFRAIGSRDEPWYGSFAIDHLGELSLEEGTELLRRLAAQDGDKDLVTFLDSPRGRARLAALHHLAGGSPRLWTVLASCARVKELDELVPAVEQLLENLVTYYQQRLWELPPNEARLIKALGTGPPSATVAELAAACGLGERTAATALGRLADAGWVRAEKLPRTDRRKTWYRLREPMLRHHFQYRSGDRGPLRLIVEMLRAWYDAPERSSHLAGVPAGSLAEAHLLATFALDPPGLVSRPWFARDVDHLVAEARRWISDDVGSGMRHAGLTLDAVVIGTRCSVEEAEATLTQRGAPVEVWAWVRTALTEATRAGTTENQIGRVLDIAAATSNDPGVELVAACWSGNRRIERLSALVATTLQGRLALLVRHELARALLAIERDSAALSVMEVALAEFGPQFQEGDRDLLRLRLDRASARLDLEEVLTLVEDHRRQLGCDDLQSLEAERKYADVLASENRHEDALVAYQQLAEHAAAVVGEEAPDVLRVRQNVALQLNASGRPREALAVLEETAAESARLMGVDSFEAHLYRMTRAHPLIELGRVDEACDGIADFLQYVRHAHGDDLYAIGVLESELALLTLRAGRPEAAINHAEQALAALGVVFGPNSPRVLLTRLVRVNILRALGRHDQAFSEAYEISALASEAGLIQILEKAGGEFVLSGMARLSTGSNLPIVEVDAGHPAEAALEVLRDLQAARDGSMEALARLGPELQPIAKSLRNI